MSFWKSLFGRGESQAQPRFVHPFKDDARVVPALAAARRRDGTPAAALFKALDGRWEWRTELVRQMEAFTDGIPRDSREGVLNRLVDKGEPFWLLVRGWCDGCAYYQDAATGAASRRFRWC